MAVFLSLIRSLHVADIVRWGIWTQSVVVPWSEFSTEFIGRISLHLLRVEFTHKIP